MNKRKFYDDTTPVKKTKKERAEISLEAMIGVLEKLGLASMFLQDHSLLQLALCSKAINRSLYHEVCEGISWKGEKVMLFKHYRPVKIVVGRWMSYRWHPEMLPTSVRSITFRGSWCLVSIRPLPSHVTEVIVETMGVYKNDTVDLEKKTLGHVKKLTVGRVENMYIE